MKKFYHVQKIGLIWLLVFLWILFGDLSNSFAHKVNIFAYTEGDLVYTESYFPDGRKVEGGTVEVYDSQGNKLLSGTTDKNGQFNFRAPKKDDLNIVLIASMGHKNSYLLSANDLPEIKDQGETAVPTGSPAATTSEPLASTPPQTEAVSEPQTPTTPPTSSSPATPATTSKVANLAPQIDLKEIKKIIDQSLDERLKPLMRELAKSQQEEKVSATEIFGGIGYIFGLLGLALYFMKNQKKDR